jgi:cell fate regulator YaaT (PSP1 superfamily)
MPGNNNYNDLVDIRELENLEDKDIEIKKKIKKDYKFEADDFFYRVKLIYNNYSKICRIKQQNITKGYFLVIPTAYGPEIGIVQGKVENMEEVYSQDEVLDVIRVASKSDREKYSENLKKERDAFNIAMKKIEEYKLDMKLVNVHYFLEDSKILFNFTADGRIDFRELVKDLASIFKTRIELRQIGVRDECRIIAGYGHCGRHFCCSNVVNELMPITIKMAKEQNVTLNSLKISGACGRLLCCLSYENETYAEEKKRFPDLGSKIKVNNKWFNVSEINIQTKNVKLVSLSEENATIMVNVNLIQYDKSKQTGFVKEKIEGIE